MRFVVVGGGKMAIEIVLSLRDQIGAVVVGCIGEPAREMTHSRLAIVCSELGIGYTAVEGINSDQGLDALRNAAPDYIVSGNNFLIFGPEALSVPTIGTINFHNGPLPRYGGLNACSWALVNGERSHGVTWHLIEGAIDSGPVLAQRNFALANEPVIQLIGRCIAEGTASFKELLPGLIAGTAKATPQDQSQRLYYDRKAKPFAGWLPWWHSAATAERLAAAIAFHPYPNTFFRPQIRTAYGQSVFTESLEIVPTSSQSQEGFILEVGDDEVTVSLPDGAVRLTGLFDENGIPLEPEAILFQRRENAGRLVRPPGFV